ncbi:hypothetical protein Bca101_101687 [Brassica carinata]
MTIRQYAYQHAGPSRGLSAGDIRHEDCPRGDFCPRGLSVSTHISTLALPVDCLWTNFRHEDCPWVILAYEDCPPDAYQHEDCPPVRISARWPFPWTIRGDFRHEDCPSVRISARWPFPWTIRGTHISTLALPVDCPGDFCPRGLSVSTHISTLALPVDCLWTNFRHEDCPWVILAYEDCPPDAYQHEDCPSVRISARWPFPWTIRG